MPIQDSREQSCESCNFLKALHPASPYQTHTASNPNLSKTAHSHSGNEVALSIRLAQEEINDHQTQQTIRPGNRYHGRIFRHRTGDRTARGKTRSPRGVECAK